MEGVKLTSVGEKKDPVYGMRIGKPYQKRLFGRSNVDNIIGVIQRLSTLLNRP
jgi:hypothetical protein